MRPDDVVGTGTQISARLCVCVVSCEPNGEAHLQQISIVGCSQSIEMWLVL